ncbi:MAG: beta-glucuronidase [Opitutaceae bacterium]|jgi:beta-glucuronidase|nr:beta-glucuronidase [Opitutaceae bacterium]
MIVQPFCHNNAPVLGRRQAQALFYLLPSMLYPIDTETRSVLELGGVWDFCPDADGAGLKAHWESEPWPAVFPMPVPASYNDIMTDAHMRDHVGPVWYRRTVCCPETWRSQQVRLRFGAAAHHALVWVNGRLLCSHQGGFLPFEAEATPLLKFGPDGANTIVVLIDNILDWTTLPPGEVRCAGMDGGAPGAARARQDYFHDFFNYAGLHRPVRLVMQPRLGIEDIRTRVSRDMDDGAARLWVETVTPAPACRVTLADPRGHTVAEGLSHPAAGHACELRVAAPQWWSPGAPALYELKVEALDADGALRDCYRLPLGLRTVRVDGDCFLLNERPFYFRGFGRHEDADLRGKGHDDAVNVRDINLLKWVGANSVRTSHYPYAEEFLRLADREGIAVIGECPAVGLYRFDEQENPVTPIFTDEKAGGELRRHHLDTVRDMINRDRNHACILMWSLGNETATHEDAGVEHFTAVARLARALDPSRPLTIVECNYPRHSRIGGLVDVIAINRYYGWYLDCGDLAAIAEKFHAEIGEWRRRWKKPMLLSEYGADAVAGLHKLPSAMFSEEFQVDYLKAFNRALDAHSFIIGEHVWVFADFATKQGITRIDGNRKGVFTRQRQPKAAAFYLKERWERMRAGKT